MCRKQIAHTPYLSHMPITRFEDLDLSKQYTYADYLTWQF